jgi:hypothetical protein
VVETLRIAEPLESADVVEYTLTALITVGSDFQAAQRRAASRIDQVSTILREYGTDASRHMLTP